MEYLKGQIDDVEKIYQLNKELIDKYEDVENIEYDKVLKWVKKKIFNNIEDYRVIYKNNKRVGYCRFYEVDDKMELDDLYILPKSQNQGIGTQVLKDLIETTTKPIFLYVFTENIEAIKFYKKLGFKITQNIKNTRCIMERYNKNEIK